MIYANLYVLSLVEWKKLKDVDRILKQYEATKKAMGAWPTDKGKWEVYY